MIFFLQQHSLAPVFNHTNIYTIQKKTILQS